MLDYLTQINALGEEPIGKTDPYHQVGAYQGTVYQRGACVLHMLRRVMGDDAFFKSLRRFAVENQGRRVNIGDFRRICEKEYGQSLKWFFDEWLYRTGILKIAYNYSMENQPDGSSQVTLTIRQGDKPYRMPVDVILRTELRSIRRTLWISEKQGQFRFKLESPVTAVDFDPDGWLMLPTPRRLLQGGPS